MAEVQRDFNRPIETDTIKGSADLIRANQNALLHNKFQIGTNVPTTTNAENDYLFFDKEHKVFYRYENGVWNPIVKLQIDNLYDVVLTSSLNNNQVLTWDSANKKWTNTDIDKFINIAELIKTLKQNMTINDIKDINITKPVADNSVLQYDDATGKWINVPIDTLAGDIEFGKLKDIKITSPVEGQLLKYDSATGKWINDTSYAVYA